MNIAIIPARKGSERCPGKNTKIIGNTSIAEITIEFARDSNLFDKIIVSSDDHFVQNITENYKDLIFDYRDEILSGSDAPLISVIKYIIRKFDISQEDTICLLPVTNPLRTQKDLEKGFETFKHYNKKNRVLSVTEMDFPIEMAWKVNDEGILYNENNLLTTKKQSFNTSYKWNDAFIIDTAYNFFNEDYNLFSKTPVPSIMPPERSFFIDYLWQLNLIELILKNG